MKTLKTILNLATIALLIFALISYFTNNLTDAIFSIVLAILIRQGVSECERRITCNTKSPKGKISENA